MEKCSACGAPLENGKCSYCGASSVVSQPGVAQPQPAVQPQVVYQTVAAPGTTIDVPAKSKWTAFFLCLLLGAVGGHCFYTGKSGMGVVYLLTAGLLGFGVIVDLIRILTGSYRDKWGRNLVG